MPKSALHGKSISEIEVTNISAHGFWILVGGRESFLPFEDFPWFKDVPVGRITNVQLLHSDHLYWPDLDVDLALESVDHPEKFPLMSRNKTARSIQSVAKQRRRKRFAKEFTNLRPSFDLKQLRKNRA